MLLRLPHDTAELLDRLIASVGAVVGRNRAAVIHALAVAHPTGAAALGCLARALAGGGADLQGLSDAALERVRAAHETETAHLRQCHESALEAERASLRLAVVAAEARGRLAGLQEARTAPGISHEAASVLVRALPEHAARILARHGVGILVDDDSDEMVFVRRDPVPAAVVHRAVEGE